MTKRDSLVALLSKSGRAERGLTMSDGRSMRVDECDGGTGITSLIE